MSVEIMIQGNKKEAHPRGPIQPGPLDPEALIQKALDLLASDRYLEKGIGLMALTGRRPAEIFFSASFSLPPKKLPSPALIFDGQLKTRHAPGTSFEPYRCNVIDDPMIGHLVYCFRPVDGFSEKVRTLQKLVRDKSGL